MEISDVHKNTKLIIDSTPYNVEDVEFVKPGKGRAIYRLRLRNLLNNSSIDRTFHSGEKVEETRTTNYEEQYLYREGQHYVFMDTGTFEQHFVDEAQLGDKRHFLKEGMIVGTLMMGDRYIDINLPNFVELKVVQTGVSTKTATVTPQTKAAVLETGYSIEVPPFVKEGDTIKVDTRSGTYVERATTKK